MRFQLSVFEYLFPVFVFEEVQMIFAYKHFFAKALLPVIAV